MLLLAVQPHREMIANCTRTKDGDLHLTGSIFTMGDACRCSIRNYLKSAFAMALAAKAK